MNFLYLFTKCSGYIRRKSHIQSDTNPPNWYFVLKPLNQSKMMKLYFHFCAVLNNTQIQSFLISDWFYCLMSQQVSEFSQLFFNSFFWCCDGSITEAHPFPVIGRQHQFASVLHHDSVNTWRCTSYISVFQAISDGFFAKSLAFLVFANNPSWITRLDLG